MTLDQINQMEIAAQHCDDYSQWRREMDEVARLRALHGGGRRVAAPKGPTPVKIPTRGTKARSISHALELMDQKLGYTS